MKTPVLDIELKSDYSMNFFQISISKYSVSDMYSLHSIDSILLLHVNNIHSMDHNNIPCAHSRTSIGLSFKLATIRWQKLFVITWFSTILHLLWTNRNKFWINKHYQAGRQGGCRGVHVHPAFFNLIIACHFTEILNCMSNIPTLVASTLK